MKKIVLICIASLMLSATAVTLNIAQSAEQAVVEGTDLTLNGIAVQSELRKEWFLSSLYLTSPSSDADSIISDSTVKRMEIKVLADSLSGRRLKRFWVERIKNNNEAADVLGRAKEVRTLSTHLGQNLESGDVIHIDYIPASGTAISINDTEVARLSVDIFPLILKTWIGERPPTNEFKDAILGEGSASERSDLSAKADSIVASQSRIDHFSGQSAAAKAEAERLAQIEEAKAEADRLAAIKRQEDAAEAERLRIQAQTDAIAQQEADDAEALRLAEEQDAKDAAELLAQQAEVVQQPVVEAVPAGPTEAEIAQMRSEYTASVRNHYGPFFKYPIRGILQRYAKRGSLQFRKGRTHGIATITLEIDKSGDLIGGSLVQSSGEKLLDDAVLSALFDAVPYPAMPEDFPESTFTTTIAISIPKPQL